VVMSLGLSLSLSVDTKAFASLANVNQPSSSQPKSARVQARPLQRATVPAGAEELAFVLLRPKCVSAGLTSAVLNRFRARGLALVNMRLTKPGAELARAHLEAVGALSDADEHALALAADVTRGPVVLSTWKGPHATRAVLMLIGDADVGCALPGTIRGDFDITIAHELVDAAKTAEQASALHALWFDGGADFAPATVGAGALAAPPAAPPSAPPPAAPPPDMVTATKSGERGKVAFRSEGRFYVTTAINYANGSPHMGHAYEGVCSDVIARYHRAYGRDVFFLTGADEHGQKIADTALKEGLEPIALCDRSVSQFRQLNAVLRVKEDGYVRTTSARHKAGVSRVWRTSAENGDVYLGVYSGWYNVREETFVTESDAQANDYKDAVSGAPLKKMEEASYFFRLSKYQQQIIDHINANPQFVQPDVRRNEVLERLRVPLQDLSVSRTTFSWGIPVPADSAHVMYVWFDALSNYLTEIGYPDGDNMAYWPASVHVIGKDITWFHCVIWPALLMSIGMPLPTTILAHGFVHGADGRKMSKSLGNVVDPLDVLKRFSVDSFRFFVVRDSPFGGDLTFSEDALALRHNGELADTFGNLVHRSLTLCEKYCGSKVPPVAAEVVLDLDALRDATEKAYGAYALHTAMELAVAALMKVNKYVTDAEPWHMQADDPKRLVVVRTLLEYVYALTHFLQPVLVDAAPRVFEKLATPPIPIAALSAAMDHVSPGTQTSPGEVLFPKVETAEALKRFEEEAAAKKAAAAKVAAKARAAAAGGACSDLAKVELRVGRVLSVEKHPEADTLYVEDIDLGGDTPRKVVSGLVTRMPPEALLNKLVVCVANIKPSKMRGVESQAMLLCAFADGDSRAELVEPPAGAVIGERITFEGHEGEPETVLNPKKKIWEKLVQPELNTSETRVARYKSLPFTTSAGPCTASSIQNGAIK